MTSSGAVIRQQVRVKVKLPSNPEEFRRRFDLLWAGIELAKIKNPNHPILHTSSEKLWAGHVKYILGPEVKGLQIKHMDGSVAKSPSWDLVLHYNQEILNKAAELMNEGDDASKGAKYDIAAAMEAARKDPAVRQSHLIEKFSLQGSGKRERETSSEENPNKAHRELAKQNKQLKAAAAALTKVQGKGGKQGDPKGGKGGKQGGKTVQRKGGKKGGGKVVGNITLPPHMSLKSQSAAGKAICFKYGRGKCTAANCTMEHICQLCEQPHKWKDCALLN